MKLNRLLLFLVLLIVFPAFSGCSPEKDMAQRRNLMMPHKDELPRNSKYKGIKKRKAYKHRKKKKNKRRRRASIDCLSKEQNLPA